MQRRLAPIVALLWLAISGWYWWQAVPLRPDAIFEVGPGEFLEGIAPSGELMISKSSPEKPASGGVVVRHGPLVCRDPFMADNKRVLFHPGDTILSASHDQEGRAIIVREGVAWLASILNGNMLEPLPGFPTGPGWIYWLKSNRLVSTSGGSIVVYDLSSKRTIASLSALPPVQWNLGYTSDRHVVVANNRRTTAAPNGEVQIIDVMTGEVDTRFSALSSMGSVMLSPDDRYVIVRGVKSLTAYDYATASELWSADVTLKTLHEIRFEDGGGALAIAGVDANNRRQIVRWQLADGRLETETPDRSDENRSRQLIEGTSYAIESVVVTRPIWEQVAIHALNQVDFWIRGSWGTRGDQVHRNRLLDTSTETDVGPLPSGFVSGSALPNERGLMIWSHDVPAPETARFYSFPLGRDWIWLMTRGLLPAILFLAFTRCVRRRRRSVDVQANGSVSDDAPNTTDRLHELSK